MSQRIQWEKSNCTLTALQSTVMGAIKDSGVTRDELARRTGIDAIRMANLFLGYGQEISLHEIRLIAPIIGLCLTVEITYPEVTTA